MADDYLKLTDIRIRGLGSVIDSSWFKIGGKLTYFSLPESFDSQGFLEALQALNPPYDIHSRQPFREYPNITRQGKYQKRVRPERRTIALTIFAAQPRLVHRLAEITPHLYETDRVEVGRRMDYTRWINFVEIASSSRWSEIDDEMKKLFDTLGGNTVGKSSSLKQLIFSYQPTDRIKHESLTTLETFVEKCRENQQSIKYRIDIDEILFVIKRHKHFQQAKEVITQVLPTFHIVSPLGSTEERKSAKGSTSPIKLIQAVEEIIAAERERSGEKPIFLFDEGRYGLSGNAKSDFRRYLHDISRSFQCLSITAAGENLENAGADKILTLEEIGR